MSRKWKPTGKKVSFVEKVYKIYKLDEYKSGGSELRISAWIVNGELMKPRFERRDYFLTGETGERKTGKCKGLTMEDVNFIANNASEIISEMTRITNETQAQAQEQESIPAEAVPDWAS